jgi:hypothetical protein
VSDEDGIVTDENLVDDPTHGTAADHPGRETQPFLVAPTTENAFNVLSLDLVAVACLKLQDILFEFDSSFPNRKVATMLSQLPALRERHRNARGVAPPLGIEPNLAWTADDDRIAWWIVGDDGGQLRGKADFRNDETARRGTKIEVFGTAEGDVLIQPYSGGFGYGMFRANVVTLRKIKYRVNFIVTDEVPARPGRRRIPARAPTRTHTQARDHIKVANVYLRQAGIELIPDDSVLVLIARHDVVELRHRQPVGDLVSHTSTVPQSKDMSQFVRKGAAVCQIRSDAGSRGASEIHCCCTENRHSHHARGHIGRNAGSGDER